MSPPDGVAQGAESKPWERDYGLVSQGVAAAPKATLTRPSRKPWEQAYAQPVDERASHSTIGDISRSALGALETGAGEGVQGIGDVTGWESASNLGKRIEAAGAREQANVSPEFAETTSHPILSRAGFNPTNIASKAINTVAGMAPQLVGTAVAGALGGGVAAIPVGAALFGTQGEAAGRNAGAEQVAALTPEELAKVPGYREAIQQGVTPEQFRAQLSEKAANLGALTSGLFGAGLGVVGEVPGVGAAGRAVAARLTRPLGERAAQAVGKGVAEGAGFAGINAAGQVAGNVTNPVPTPALQGVGEAAASGVLPGFVLGGARGVLTRPPARTVETRSEPNPGAAPGSLSDAANVLHRTAMPARAGGEAETKHEAAPESAAQGEGLRLRVAPIDVPWVDKTTGEATPPSDNQVLAALHAMRDQADAIKANGNKPTMSTPQVAAAWGIAPDRLRKLQSAMTAERRKGVTTSDAEARAAQEPQLPIEPGNPVDTLRASGAAQSARLRDLQSQLDQTGETLANIRARLEARQQPSGSEIATSNDAAKPEQAPTTAKFDPGDLRPGTPEYEDAFQKWQDQRDAQRPASASEDRRAQDIAAIDARNADRDRFAEWFRNATDGDTITDNEIGQQYKVIERTRKDGTRVKTLAAVDENAVPLPDGRAATGISITGDRESGLHHGAFNEDLGIAHPEDQAQGLAASFGKQLREGSMTTEKSSATESPESAPPRSIEPDKLDAIVQRWRENQGEPDAKDVATIAQMYRVPIEDVKAARDRTLPNKNQENAAHDDEQQEPQQVAASSAPGGTGRTISDEARLSSGEGGSAAPAARGTAARAAGVGEREGSEDAVVTPRAAETGAASAAPESGESAPAAPQAQPSESTDRDTKAASEATPAPEDAHAAEPPAPSAPATAPAGREAGEGSIPSPKAPEGGIEAKTTPQATETQGKAANVGERAGKKDPWQMTREQHRAADPRLVAATKARDAAQAAMGGRERFGETRRFSGAQAGNRLEKLDKANARWSAAFSKADAAHRKAVVEALSAGKSVPAEVLADYPDIARPTVEAAAKERAEVAVSARHVAASPVTMKAARTSLLRQIDEATAKAPSVGLEHDLAKAAGSGHIAANDIRRAKRGRHMSDDDVRREIRIDRRANAMNRISAVHGFVTLDVPGDGKFRVVNTKERLAEFRKQVESRFKTPSVPRPASDEAKHENRSLRLTDAQRKEILDAGETHEPETEVTAAARESAAHPENEQPEPTPAQHEAGNFKMGHVNLHGLDVTIQIPKGGLRRGTDRTGKPWERAASDHYGHIRRTEGADGEQVDVYLGPHAEDPKPNVFVIDQVKPGTRTFDEHKAMVGFKTGREARASYDANFPKGLATFGGIRKMSMDEFKDWLKRGDTTKPVSDRVASLPRGTGARKSTTEGAARVVAARKALRDAINDTSTGRAERADKIAKLRDRVQFMETHAGKVELPKSDGSTQTVQGPGPTTIEDFGEKLGGARKDLTPSLDKTLSDDDIARMPLSKIWPMAEVEAMTDPYAAAVAYAARAEVPAKPRKGWKLKRWVEKVQTVRELGRLAASGKLPPETLKGRTALGDFAARVHLLQNIDREQWGRIGSVHEHPNAYAYGADGEHIPKPSVMVSIDGRWESFDGAKSIDEALSAIKSRLGMAAPEKKLQFEIRGNKKLGDYFINKKGDKEQRRLKTFTDLGEARAYLKTNHADLVKAWEAVKDRDNVTKADMRNATNRDRMGPDYRNGADVTPEQFADSFGFRGVEFGNWVKQGAHAKERQGLLNQAYDALMDLANLIGVPPRAISLDGSLGLGLGSRGHGWASAHFEPDRLVINLTKTRGAGALAHEWFHALDNYFARLRGAPEFGGSQQAYRDGNFVTYRPGPMMVNPEVPSAGRMSRAELMNRHARFPDAKLYDPANWKPDPNHPAGVRPVVEKAFADLVKALNESPMHERSLTLTKGLENGYWSQIIERAARSFENYVIARMDAEGISNDYLANVRKLEDFNRNPARYPYLRPDELKPVAEAFDNLFNTVETRNTENGNVALFSQPEQRDVRSLADARRAAAQNIVGRTLENEHGVVPAVLSRTTLDKMLSEKAVQKSVNGVEHARAVANLDHLYRIGMLDHSHPDTRGEPTISAIHRVVAPMRAENGDTLAVLMTVKETTHPKNPNPLYSVEAVRIEKPALVAPETGVERGTDSNRPPLQAGFDPNVTRMLQDFNKNAGSPQKAGAALEAAQPTGQTGAGGSLHRGRIQKLVDATTANWGENQPRVRVVADAEGLPSSAKADPGYKTAEGYYDPKTGTAYLVASNLDSPRRAMEVLAHEAIGHHGVENVVDTAFGTGAWQKVADAIGRLDKSGRASDTMRGVLQETHRRYPGADPTTFAKEFLAVSAEKGVRNAFLDRVVTAIRKFLRQIMPHLQLNERELRQALVQAERYVRESTPYRERIAQKAAMAFSSKPDTFYSALTEAVATGKGAPKKADAAAWKQWLDGAQRRGEFKGAEREWMGVDQWLDQHKGPVTRAELNEFVRDNQVRVQEVVRRDEIPMDEAAGIHENDDGTFELVDHEGAVGESTKFGNYTLPGGKNYRELLLTLPPHSAADGGFGDWQQHARKMGFSEAEIERVWNSPERESDPEIQAWRHDQTSGVPAAQFRSGHFDEPNIVAHVRMNDRTGPDGAKILHVEEVQSDWHQAGRKGGYFDPNKPWEVFRLRDGEPAGQFATESDAKAEAQRLGREFDYALGNEGGDRARVPNAPFKKEWPMLVMKRVLRYAADHGYDKVTWTTGEQQADRYDLSKQVDRIRYVKRGDGGFDLRAKPIGGSDERLLVQDAKPAQLDEYVGKELAAKIRNGEGHPHPGGGRFIDAGDLKLGGEGMKAFYDKMLPNELNKYVKQWGAKVGESTIDTQGTGLAERREYVGPTLTADRVREIAAEQPAMVERQLRDAAALMDRGDSLQEAMAEHGSISSAGALGGKMVARKVVPGDVHSIDITPAMRESVVQGQPMFSRPEPASERPSDPSREPHNTVKDIEAVLRDGDPGGVREKAKGWLRGKFEDFRPAMLGAIQTRHLLELMENSPPLKGSGKQYGRLMQQMDADRQQLMTGAPDAAEHPGDMLKRGAVTIAQALRQYAYGKGLGALRGRVRPEAQKLFDMMHAATIQRMDPDKVYERLTIENAHGDAVPWTHEEVKARLKLLRELALQRGGDPWSEREKIRDETKYLRNIAKMERARERNWPKLQADWQALPEEAKGLYREVRDWYSQYRDETEKALIKNIEALDMPETYRRSLVQRMRLRFEEARREGVYFPLNRDGDFWIAFKDREGNEGFKMFESAREFERGEKRLRAAGFQIDAKGRRDHNMKAADAPPGTFVRQVIDILQQAKVSESVQDEVYQTFLRSLPELSMRKHAIHRKNIAGYSEDALRAFAKNGYHGAHQLARLRHAQDMGFALEAMKASVDNWRRGENSTDEKKEPSALEVAKADALVGEMAKRHDWIMHPTDQRLANMINSLGFVYYLGASPASALTNLTQVAQTVLPVLGAEHGWGKATRMLGAAWRDAARTGGHMDRTLKDPDERRAFMVMQQRGDFSKTQSHTLAGLAEGNVLQTSPAWSRTMNAISWMFHTAEVINREATGMAAYRLARSNGMDFNQAIEYAGKTNADANFDYSAGNRPRYMQGNVQRVALQFKNYSVGMSWLFYRNLFQAMKGETPEIRRVARRTVTGILGMTAILAGATGLPVYNAVRMTANAANTLWGDDNEPWNFDDAFHRWLADNLGPDAAKLIAEGPTNYLTGANVASRTSMANLWIRDDDQRLEGADAYHALLENLAGPIGGIVNNWYVGAEDVRRGHLERGVERMLPTAVKNSIKSLRYAHEGVNSLRGDPIVPDVSGWQDFLQAIGFQPAAVADQYRINTAMKNYTGEIGDRRVNLMNAYALALKAGDDGDLGTALRKINAFNQAHPEVAITAARLRASLRQRARISAQARNGVILNRRLALQAQQYAGVAQ